MSRYVLILLMWSAILDKISPSQLPFKGGIA
jgi:hypothetical protein